MRSNKDIKTHGGTIKGPKQPPDQVPIMATGGEYVMPVDTTEKLLPLLELLRALTHKESGGNFVRAEDGGEVKEVSLASKPLAWLANLISSGAYVKALEKSANEGNLIKFTGPEEKPLLLPPTVGGQPASAMGEQILQTRKSLADQWKNVGAPGYEDGGLLGMAKAAFGGRNKVIDAAVDGGMVGSVQPPAAPPASGPLDENGEPLTPERIAARARLRARGIPGYQDGGVVDDEDGDIPPNLFDQYGRPLVGYERNRALQYGNRPNDPRGRPASSYDMNRARREAGYQDGGVVDQRRRWYGPLAEEQRQRTDAPPYGTGVQPPQRSPMLPTVPPEVMMEAISGVPQAEPIGRVGERFPFLPPAVKYGKPGDTAADVEMARQRAQGASPAVPAQQIPTAARVSATTQPIGTGGAPPQTGLTIDVSRPATPDARAQSVSWSDIVQQAGPDQVQKLYRNFQAGAALDPTGRGGGQLPFQSMVANRLGYVDNGDGTYRLSAPALPGGVQTSSIQSIGTDAEARARLAKEPAYNLLPNIISAGNRLQAERLATLESEQRARRGRGESLIEGPLAVQQQALEQRKGETLLPLTVQQQQLELRRNQQIQRLVDTALDEKSSPEARQNAITTLNALQGRGGKQQGPEIGMDKVLDYVSMNPDSFRDTEGNIDPSKIRLFAKRLGGANAQPTWQEFYKAARADYGNRDRTDQELRDYYNRTYSQTTSR